MSEQGSAESSTIRIHGPRRSVERPGSEVAFPPVANGLDYLVSVAKHLAVDEEERISASDLKYGVLHLQAAAEVLLKYRLQLEHWTLVFANPGKARKKQLDDGTLASCTSGDSVDRLGSIVGLTIDQNDTEALAELAKTRNKLQHYGLPDGTSRAIETRVAEVLDFLLRFLDDHLLPNLSPDERSRAEAEMDHVRSGLTQIQAFVTKRMQRLQAELQPHRAYTVRCLECRQWAVVATDDPVSCRFCTDAWPVELFREQYVEEGAASPFGTVEDCPKCGTEALICGLGTAAAPETLVDLCFHCGEISSGLQSCLLCDRMFLAIDTETVCEHCLRERVARED
jgi:hypothetical protein